MVQKNISIIFDYHKKMNNAEQTSLIELKYLGIIAISLGVVAAIDGLLYHYPFFTSISESGTTGVETGMILPFALGAMAVFFFGYSGYWTEITIFAL